MKQVLPADAISQGTTPQRRSFSLRLALTCRVQPDGTEVLEEVPQSRRSALPRRRGTLSCTNRSIRAISSLASAPSRTFYATQPDVVVLGDCRVDWGVEGVRPLGPDIVVLFDVRQWLRRATYRRAEEGGRPVLVVEIGSPSTRVHDLGAKLDLYYRVGVQQYVIVDRGPQNEDPKCLIGYRRGPTGWLPLVPDTQGD